MWAAGVLGVVLVIGGFIVRRLDADKLGGAVAQASWDVMVRPMWWGVVLLAGVRADGDARLRLRRPGCDRRACRCAPARRRCGRSTRRGRRAHRGRRRRRHRRHRRSARVDRAAHRRRRCAARAVRDHRDRPARRRIPHGRRHRRPSQPSRSGRRPATIAVAALAGVAVLAGVVWLARPGRDVDAAEATGEGTVCNGHAELCDGHSTKSPTSPRTTPCRRRRSRGGSSPNRPTRSRCSSTKGCGRCSSTCGPGSRPARSCARRPAATTRHSPSPRRSSGPRSSPPLSASPTRSPAQATGAEARFLCHGLCETGSTPFLDTLEQLRSWLIANPDEVVTLFIEDHVDAAPDRRRRRDGRAARLRVRPVDRRAVADARRDDPLRPAPRRDGRGGRRREQAPWLVNGFEFTQDTPYTFPTVESFSCDPNRGPDDAPLLLLNHWLSGFSSLVTDAQLVNARDVLLPRAEQCQEERGPIPNFVAVNYVALGDVYGVVDDAQRRRLAVRSVRRCQIGVGAGDAGVPVRARLRVRSSVS